MGGMVACALIAMSVTVVQPGFAKREPKRAGKGVVPLSDGREILFYLGMKTAFSCTLNAIIRG